MENIQPKLKIIVPIIILIILVIVLILVLKKPKTESVPEESQTTEISWVQFTDLQNRFSFSYPENGEFGIASQSLENPNGINFSKGQPDAFTMFGFGFGLLTREQTEKQYASAMSLESSGDYNPRINGAGWESERILLENNSQEGFIPCATEGVWGAFLCEIKILGGKKFLIKYTHDTYKGQEILKNYITYNDNVRYEFWAAAYFFTDGYMNAAGDFVSVQYAENEFLEKIKNHIPSEREILAEKIISSLTFTK